MKTTLDETMSSKPEKIKVLKLPTIRRLPLYLHLLENHQEAGEETISSNDLAKQMDLEQIVIRKDLSVTGIVGKPRIGYNVDELIAAIRKFIQWDTSQEAILVGAGHLGSALLRYTGFENMGVSIPVAFDSDPAVIDTRVGDTKVYPIDKMEYMIKRIGWKMAILCVPAQVAQEVADHLVDAGITAIWNFAPIQLQLPNHVVIQQENLSSGLAVLRVKQASNEAREKSMATEADVDDE